VELCADLIDRCLVPAPRLCSGTSSKIDEVVLVVVRPGFCKKCRSAAQFWVNPVRIVNPGRSSGDAIQQASLLWWKREPVAATRRRWTLLASVCLKPWAVWMTKINPSQHHHPHEEVLKFPTLMEVKSNVDLTFR
jgi:hypothetical protein